LAQPLVAAFISSAITDFHDSQDVLQEVAAAVFARAGEGTGESPRAFQAWALGIARHKVADYCRGRSRRPGLVLMDGELLDGLAAAYIHLAEDFGRRREALEHCVRHVQGEALTLLEMRYKEDLQPEEIAARTGRQSTAVRVALHRLRTLLRECIEGRLQMRGA
jgi:RNA polymerase sigma-70 factor (ECF subfamily)